MDAAGFGRCITQLQDCLRISQRQGALLDVGGGDSLWKFCLSNMQKACLICSEVSWSVLIASSTRLRQRRWRRHAGIADTCQGKLLLRFSMGVQNPCIDLHCRSGPCECERIRLLFDMYCLPTTFKALKQNWTLNYDSTGVRSHGVDFLHDLFGYMTSSFPSRQSHEKQMSVLKGSEWLLP